MSFGKRLKSVIKEERYTQGEFAEEMNVTRGRIEEYIAERNKPSGELFMAMTKHKVFRKYTMWLLSGEVEPNSGQISPAFSTQEKCGLISGTENIQKKA
ncbi:helix-turn-helix domain-containing protein [Shewanella sp. D64]|uniref:helix-turn-helix domain-containing protein n=1 Tax=unclassified Shewanella TaxID=196818 RepID=UPI0022BA2E60|nr:MULTISPECIES: helix-turn-helix transcriptional regulator [unclassified Shewanella]MEC4729067.1 helix-turn-helix domain-containing protein [Shewanella sp. D64]MEC4740858.1 helix-turn-helix domain-containing protein [Shewanella sp. E94]WBJ95290.1 helix-turn-helix domain-containing protein [Shewanella sp. MTB7]